MRYPLRYSFNTPCKLDFRLRDTMINSSARGIRVPIFAKSSRFGYLRFRKVRYAVNAGQQPAKSPSNPIECFRQIALLFLWYLALLFE